MVYQSSLSGRNESRVGSKRDLPGVAHVIASYKPGSIYAP